MNNRGVRGRRLAQPLLTEAGVVSDLPRILTLAAETPMTKELRDAVLVALWAAVAQLVPTERFRDLESFIGALEAAYMHYGAERFAAGLQQGRSGVARETATPPSVH